MKLQQTIMEKNFHVKMNNKLYYVSYLNSDGQTLALLNRNNWEIFTEDHELLDIYSFKGDNKAKKLKAEKNLILS